MIISITDQAKSKLNQLFIELNISNKIFRLYIRDISELYGPVFDIALDKSTEDDKIFKCDGYSVIVNKYLASKITAVNIYFKPAISKSGFRITTDLEWEEEYYDCKWAQPLQISNLILNEIIFD